MFKYDKEYRYPKSWDEADITRFKYYLKVSKDIYKKLPEDVIELCCERQIMEEKGILKPFDYSIVKENLDIPEALEIYNS